MSVYNLSIKTVLFLIFVSVGYSSAIIAKDMGYAREVDNHFATEQKSKTTIFKSLPSTHISPVNNHLIFSLETSYLDAKVRGKSDDPFANNPQTKDQLKLNSVGIAPSLMLSGQHFGAGVTTEISEAHSEYQNYESGLREIGQLRYYGYGGQALFSPNDAKSLARLTFVVGMRYYTATHIARTTTTKSGEISSSDWERKKYNVIRNMFGTNLQLRLLDSFSLIPWVNFTQTHTDELDNLLNRNPETSSNSITHRERLDGDAESLWRRGDRLEYGLDIAVQIKRFKIHIGNIIGLALKSNQTESERIKNHAYKISVIFLNPVNKPGSK